MAWILCYFIGNLIQIIAAFYRNFFRKMYILYIIFYFYNVILICYSFGSSILCRHNESLACPNARWLGIHPSESIIFGVKTISLTKIDFAKLKSIETRTCVNDAILKELNILRKGKADIEAFSFTQNFLTSTYLPYKINSKKYI